MKKVIALILTLGVLLGGFSVTATAVTETAKVIPLEMPDGHFQGAAPSVSALAVSETAYDVMLDAVINHKSSANVLRFNIPSADAQDVYYNFLYNNPETFVVKGGGISTSAGKVSTFNFSYHDSATVAAQKLARYNAELDKIVALAPQSATELEKALFIHDYIVTHFQYDTSYSIYDAYNFLTLGTGVCESYGKTFMALARRLGLEAYTVSSYNANHLWNVVKIGGTFYHLDATFDDPIADRMGRAGHDYFLLSTKTLMFMEPNRTDWVVYGASVTCNSTSYENGYAWCGSSNPIVFLNGNRYAMVGNTLYSVNNNLTTKTAVYTQPKNKWYLYNNPYSSWSGYYGSLYAVGNVLYGNTQKGMWYYNPADGQSGYFEIDSTVGQRSIYGSFYAGNGILQLLYCTDANDQDGQTVEMDISLLTSQNLSYAEAVLNIYRSVLYGDIYNSELLDTNDDGVVNVIDLVRLKKRVA